MGRSSSMKPMRGSMVGGWDCDCCSSWTGTRAEDKRELMLEAREGVDEYFDDNENGENK